MISDKAAHVLGVLEGKVIWSRDLRRLTDQDIECLKESIVIDAIKLAHTMTPEEIGRFVNTIGLQMLKAKAETPERGE